MGALGLDPETALKLIQYVLRGAAYLLGGFALLAISTYAMFLSLQIFSSPRRAKAKIAEALQHVGCASVVEQNHDLIFAERPILTAPEGLGKEAVRVNIPPRGAQVPPTVPANLESEPTCA